MHSFGMVHCDLKPSNILVFPGPGGVNNNELKIADFGLVKERGICKDDNNFWKFRFRGTPFYVSPESLAHGEIGTPMDIWSLGCIVVEMVTGTPAWWQCLDQETLMFRLAILHETPRIPENLSEDGKDFLRKCFARDPTERWTAQMFLDHPFVIDQVSAPQLSSGSPLDLHAPSFMHLH
ncbi:Mitogen-activated protein kinase kinase kinase A [Morella rubra]|uniref:Mitogen-activated protein kinase kinase kinase A n=1 Tax=Morella rubra TaxID=262757 RepID=A0A6A1V8E6_9ROSI|nr:Mitogen-activated protein kinase kinase kinase A [Morella rubra]